LIFFSSCFDGLEDEDKCRFGLLVCGGHHDMLADSK